MKLPSKEHRPKPDTAAATDPRLVPIRFEFTHPSAITVCLAGSFNEWHPTAKTMHPLGNGRWETEMVLVPGIHEYCFVVDGRWMPDPLSKSHVANPFGGMNSLLRVGCSLESAHLIDAENLPLQSADKRQ